MTVPDDAATFLGDNNRTFMITLRKDGSPTAHPMAGWFGPECMYLNTYRASTKAKNLGHDEADAIVVTNPSDARDFEGVVFRGRARQIPEEEVFGDDVPVGLAWARNPRSEGSQDQPDIPPEGERKIGETAGRVTRGVRIIFEIAPDTAGMIDSVREG